eukprot:symbB.v1.2.001996.t1/scaffold53.1/size378684/17
MLECRHRQVNRGQLAADEGNQETIETMAMMATWCVMCGLFAGQIHAKTMENEISHSDEGASFAPILLTDQSDGDQDVSLAFKTWTWGKPESWVGEAMKVGSVGAQQRWCFVDGWEFQATNIFWMADAASPLGQLNITLTCPDAGKMMSRFQKVLEDEIVAAKGALSDAHTMGQTAAAKEKEVDLISLQKIAKSDPQSYFQEKAKGKMHCGFEALVKIELYAVDMCLERFDFYSDVVFVCIAYSCHWEWANVAAVVLVIATLGQAVGMAVAHGNLVGVLFALLGVVPHLVGDTYGGPASEATSIAGHALARVVLEDLPQVALQILFSQEVRKDPFVLMSAGVSIFFGLKKLHEVIKFFCCEKKKSRYEEFELDSDSSD